MRTKITKTAVENAKVPATEKLDNWLWDTEIKGFGCRITSAGRRVYVFQSRIHGRTRRFRLGAHGTITTDIAREQARKMAADIVRGDDPAAERAAGRSCPTLAEVADRYLREHAEPHKKASSLKDDRANLRRHVLPKLGRVPVREISRDHVWSLHHAMRDTPIAANRVVALLSKIFNLCEQWDLRPQNSNPCRHLKKYREEPRRRHLSELELARLGRVLREVEQARAESPAVIATIRLLLFTGARVGEILRMQWDHVDWERGLALLPDTKTGPSALVLSRAAIAVLQSITNRDPVWVIPGAKPGAHLVEIEKPWQRIRDRAALVDVRLHDLRHTFAATGAGEQMSLHVIGGLLRHSNPSTTRRYAHLADSPLRVAANTVGDHLERALGA